MNEPTKKKPLQILVTGAGGFAGAAITKELRRVGLEVYDLVGRDHCDLTDAQETSECFGELVQGLDEHDLTLDMVVHAAGRVRGIKGNKNENWEQLRENQAMGENVLHQMQLHNVPKGIFLGSSCQYPADAKQPYETSQLGTGPFEDTNWGYAAAKEHVRKLAVQLGYMFLIPPNLCGPGDNYDPENSHVFAAMIKKVCDAGLDGCVEHWGNPETSREFLSVTSLAKTVAQIIINAPESAGASVARSQGITLNVGHGVGAVYTLGDLWKMITEIAEKNPYARWNGSLVGATEKCMASNVTKVNGHAVVGMRSDLRVTIRKALRDYRKRFPEHLDGK